MTAKTKAQLMAELAALKQKVTDLETEQRQREIELEHWLAVERENWALAEALNQTGAAIGSSLRGEEVLDRVLEEMSRVVACDAACLLLIEGEVARVYRWRGYVRSKRATAREIGAVVLSIEQIPILQTVRQTSRPLTVSNPPANDAWVHKFGANWVKSYACAPIRNRGKVIGFLAIDSETLGFFEPADIEPLQAFADQAAMALENVGLHNRVRHEIVKRVKMLKKERNFISVVLDTADALVVALNQDGRIVHFNRACEQISGYIFAEVKNRYFWELLASETVPSTQIYFSQRSPSRTGLNSERVPTQFESYLLTKTGQRRLIAWSNTTLFDKTDDVEYIVVTGLDITERKQAEAALAQERDFLHALMDNIPDSIYGKDTSSRFTRVNKGHARMLGYDDPAEAIGKTDLDFQSPELAQALYAEEQEIIRTGRPIIGHIEFNPTHDQQPRWLSSTKAPILNEAGQVIGLVGISRDITVLVQTAAALEESEATQRAILKAIPDLMFRLNCEGLLLDFNVQQVAALIAFPEKLLGKKLPEILPPEVAQQAMVAIEQVCRTGKMRVIEAQLSFQGEVNHYEARLVSSKVDEVLAIVRNITERKRAEAALRENEERYRQSVELSPTAIFFINRAGLIQKWNRACLHLFQYGPEIVGQSYQKLLWSTEDYPIVERLVAQVFQMHSLSGVELSYRRQDGERRFTVSRLYPIFDSEGNVQECVFSNTDITNEKQAEEALRLQNEQLQARNQELDAFARTVAHDLKNPLGVLTPMAEILLEDYRDISAEKLGEYLEVIARSGRRASRIVEALLLLAGVRQKDVKVEPLDMAAIISETLQRLQPMITDYQAEIIIPATWPTVLGYGPWIEEVWVNYLSNGLKYGGQPPRLELGASPQSDGMAHFWLRDNGSGLTPEAQAQLFTEFTQLEPDRTEGHGLGLSIVRRIVEKLGGQVGVESESQLGQGSIFSFTLPLAAP